MSDLTRPTNWIMYHWLRPIPTQGSIRPRDLDRYHFEFVGQAERKVAALGSFKVFTFATALHLGQII